MLEKKKTLFLLNKNKRKNTVIIPSFMFCAKENKIEYRVKGRKHRFFRWFYLIFFSLLKDIKKKNLVISFVFFLSVHILVDLMCNCCFF